MRKERVQFQVSNFRSIKYANLRTKSQCNLSKNSFIAVRTPQPDLVENTTHFVLEKKQSMPNPSSCICIFAVISAVLTGRWSDALACRYSSTFVW